MGGGRFCHYTSRRTAMIQKGLRWGREHVRKNGPWWQFVKYGFFGVIAFGADFGLFMSLTRYFNFHPSIANLFSSLLGLAIIFFFNRRFTFQAQEGRIVQQTRRFIIISVVNYFLQQGLLWVFLHWSLLSVLGSWHDVGAKMMAISVTVISNFTGHRLWSFRHHPSPHAVPTPPPSNIR